MVKNMKEMMMFDYKNLAKLDNEKITFIEVIISIIGICTVFFILCFLYLFVSAL